MVQGGVFDVLYHTTTIVVGLLRVAVTALFIRKDKKARVTVSYDSRDIPGCFKEFPYLFPLSTVHFDDVKTTPPPRSLFALFG